jgi:hypothetical protein
MYTSYCGVSNRETSGDWQVYKAGGPDGLPAWLLKTYADIIAPAVTDVLNSSFLECKVPNIWKMADIAPLPKALDITGGPILPCVINLLRYIFI